MLVAPKKVRGDVVPPSFGYATNAGCQKMTFFASSSRKFANFALELTGK